MARSVEKTTTVTISRELHREFKMLAAKLGTTQKALLAVAIQDLIRKFDLEEKGYIMEEE